MLKKIYLLGLLALTIACEPKKQEESAATDSTSTAPPPPLPPAQLTEQQKADGWKLLFDGNTMNGWRFFKNAENNTWEVVDGTLHCKPFIEGQTEKRADLITTDQYENFELAFDWKISPQGNSGVMFRVTEEYEQPYASGPEYQVIDDKGYPGDLKEVQLSGANYDMQVASNKTVHPVGDWNNAKIVVNGNHVEHWLNGAKVVEYEINSPEWKKQHAASKWKDFPGYAKATKGHIDLQDHGNEAWFKNIMIKPL